MVAGSERSVGKGTLAKPFDRVQPTEEEEEQSAGASFRKNAKNK